MNKVSEFINKHKIAINLFVLVFWLVLLYTNYQEMKQENTLSEKKGFFVLGILFMIVAFFNLFRALKEKNTKD